MIGPEKLSVTVPSGEVWIRNSESMATIFCHSRFPGDRSFEDTEQLQTERRNNPPAHLAQREEWYCRCEIQMPDACSTIPQHFQGVMEFLAVLKDRCHTRKQEP